MSNPVKMSTFDVASEFPTGSYFIAVVPDGSTFKNVRVELTTALSARWKAVPTAPYSPGNDGDEAKDGSFYYLNVGGVWGRYSRDLSF